MSTIAPWLSVADAAAAVDFYRRALRATTDDLVEVDGVIQVARLFIDLAPFWVQQDNDLPDGVDPGRTVRMIVTVDDPDATFAGALVAGAEQIAAVHDEHGWRTGRFRDPFGHQWEVARPTH